MKNAIAWSAFVLVLLLGAYAGSYYALVETPRPFFAYTGKHLPVREPTYRFGGEWAKTFYAPVHAVDVWIRPNAWRVADIFEDYHIDPSATSRSATRP